MKTSENSWDENLLVMDTESLLKLYMLPDIEEVRCKQ